MASETKVVCLLPAKLSSITFAIVCTFSDESLKNYSNYEDPSASRGATKATDLKREEYRAIEAV